MSEKHCFKIELSLFTLLVSMSSNYFIITQPMDKNGIKTKNKREL